MVKRKRTKEQITIYKTIYRTLKIEQHVAHLPKITILAAQQNSWGPATGIAHEMFKISVANWATV